MKNTSKKMLGFLTIIILCWIAMAGCGGGGGGGDSASSNIIPSSDAFSVTVQGQLTDLSNIGTSLHSANSDKMAFYEGGIEITHVVAIPIILSGLDAFSNTIESVVDGNGFFSLSLDKSNDWLLIVVNKNAETKQNTILGYVAINNEFETLVQIPISCAVKDLDLGQILIDGSNASEYKTINDFSAFRESFNLDHSELVRISRMDDLIKQLGNVYLNYDIETGVYYKPSITFTWALPTGFRNEYLDVASTTYIGYSVGVETNDFASIGWEALQNKEYLLQLVPPAQVEGYQNQNDGVSLWSPDNPIDTSGTFVKEQYGDEVVIRDYHHACIAFFKHLIFLDLTTEGNDLIGNVPPGYWNLNKYLSLDSSNTELAAIDVSIMRPIDETGKPTIYLPCFKLNLNDEGKIISIDIKWFWYDVNFGTYMEIADLDIIENAIDENSFSFGFEDNNGHAEFFPLISNNYSNLNNEWNIDVSSNSDYFTSFIGISYKVAGTMFKFEWGHPQ